ncbi:MAG: hypothetical protein LBG44_05640 [Gemmatimonadota bacterium]|jgi:hypothetical protein|nr:hypothetical protein [Gemmatimonadota bacterium]
MKSFGLYVLLVGLPFLALIGILHIGQRLVPPRSIGGSWELLISSSGSTALLGPCSGLAPAGTSQMRLSQSGPHAEVTLAGNPPIRLALLLSGNSVHATGSSTGKSPSEGCELTLNGEIFGPMGQERMEGRISREDCPECEPMNFTAVRLSGGNAR